MVKRPGRESDHSTLPGAEVENECSAPAPPTSCHATHSVDPIISCRQSSILPRRARLLRTKQTLSASSNQSWRLGIFQDDLENRHPQHWHCALEYRFVAAAV